MHLRFSIFLLGLICLAPFSAQAKVNVFACEPEWAALADEIGGDRVKTVSATHVRQDPHYIRARPSLIAKARRADLIFCSGAGLEVGWLPILLQKAGADVQPGEIGYLMASDHVRVLEKQEQVDRSMGDVHPEGNPHVHLNPHNVLLVAEVLTARLAEIDAQNASFYQAQLVAFRINWQAAITRWETQAQSLKGATIVVHHKGFSYLLDWLDLQLVASLEPKPGIPPTTAHLEGLLQQLTPNPAHVILRTPYEPKDASLWLSARTNIPALELPYTIGGNAQSTTLIGLFDSTLSLLKDAQHDE